MYLWAEEGYGKVMRLPLMVIVESDKVEPVGVWKTIQTRVEKFEIGIDIDSSVCDWLRDMLAASVGSQARYKMEGIPT